MRFFTMMAVLVAALCLCQASANKGARTLLQSTSGCSVSTSAKAWSFNQAVCKSAYNEAIVAEVKWFCEHPDEPVPESVTLTVKAKAEAIAVAIANAAAKVSMTGYISPGCEPGSYSAFYAGARAKAMAKAVSQSFASAYALVIGYDAWTVIGAEVQAVANALAVTCETKYVELSAYHQCTKGTCASTCPITCYYQDERFTSATAIAVTEAIAEAEAIVETYFNTADCGADCEVKLCGYVCPDGC